MYLKPQDENAFLDHPKKHPRGKFTKECPRCLGYGGWNLKTFAYPLYFREDTAENRHKFCHFRCVCPNCFGWGYVEDTLDHIHDWAFTKKIGPCLREQTCSICNETITIDSSD